MRFPISDQ